MASYLDRNTILKELEYDSYEDYLKSKLWLDIRSEIFSKQKKCYLCNKKSKVVHHYRYTKENLSGLSYDDMYALCHKHHYKIEFDNEGQKLSLVDAQIKFNNMRPCIKMPAIIKPISDQHQLYLAACDAQKYKYLKKHGRKKHNYKKPKERKIGSVRSGWLILSMVEPITSIFSSRYNVRCIYCGKEDIKHYLHLGSRKNKYSCNCEKSIKQNVNIPIKADNVEIESLPLQQPNINNKSKNKPLSKKEQILIDKQKNGGLLTRTEKEILGKIAISGLNSSKYSYTEAKIDNCRYLNNNKAAWAKTKTYCNKNQVFKKPKGKYSTRMA